MEIEVRNKKIFPPEVIDILRSFYSAGFFEESMLIGSWVMPLYHEVFGMRYALRTLDIDFAVKFAAHDKTKKEDIERIMTDLGYLPVISQSGIRKFTHENLTIEFVAHRKGGRDDEVVSVKQWNISAIAFC
jgi:hypothetical protein